MAIVAREVFDPELKQGRALLFAAWQHLTDMPPWAKQLVTTDLDFSSSSLRTSLLQTARAVLELEHAQGWHCAQTIVDYLMTSVSARPVGQADYLQPKDAFLDCDEEAFQVALLQLDVWIVSNTRLLLAQASRLASQLRIAATTSARYEELDTRLLRIARFEGRVKECNHLASRMKDLRAPGLLAEVANALVSAGDRVSILQAIGLYDEQLRIDHATFGGDHPAVATTFSNKANALLRLGDRQSLMEAIGLYDEALQIRRTTLGDNHPEVASALGSKANALRELGDRESLLEAIGLHDTVLAERNVFINVSAKFAFVRFSADTFQSGAYFL